MKARSSKCHPPESCSLRLGLVSLDNLFFNVAFASLPLGGVVVLCNNNVIARLVGCSFLGGSWETQREHRSDLYQAWKTSLNIGAPFLSQR